ncbi:MAG TPA: hypothetical protein VHK02_02720 [Actinomycetota bacterium]|jgi:hypothetical protein|nr:hypothetical protein [Actinomycetota bacterium]
MRNRDTGVLALGRFLAVEQYCQSTQPFSTHPPVRRSPPAGMPVPPSGARPPARPAHG